MFDRDLFAYLDYNATTPVDRRVLDAMMPFFTTSYANPDSPHYFGNEIYKEVERAREQVSQFINADKTEVIFTSGSTEAINIALKGVAELSTNIGKHILTVATEHHAVLETCKYLETKGFEVTYLQVDNTGIIDLEALKALLRPDTILVSVMYVNNETGVIQPIKEIASLAHANQAMFFTDATQAAGKIKIDVQDLDVDFLCISGHKIYGPKGIGALYIKNGIKLTTYTHGGGQENGMRSGTLNVPGIVALGTACELCDQQMHDDAVKIGALRDKLEHALLQFSIALINGDIENRVHNVTNICFKGYDASVLIGRMKNIAVSNGSACNSAVLKPSHVLTAMGLSNEDASASIRFSLGRFNTVADVEMAINAVSKIM